MRRIGTAAAAILVLTAVCLIPAGSWGKEPLPIRTRPPAPPATINPVIPPDPFSASLVVLGSEGSRAYGSTGSGWTKVIRVNVKINASARPEKIRLGGSPDVSGSPWIRWTATGAEMVSSVSIPRGIGARSVYLEAVKAGGATARAMATFQVPAKKTYLIQDVDKARGYSQTRGFKFGQKSGDAMSRCEIWKRPYGTDRQTKGTDITLAIPAGVPGSRCDFTLFDGRRINAGWIFKNYTANPGCPPPGRNYTVNERPAADSNLVRFKVHLWADPMKNCVWTLSDMTLEGPGDGTWEDAFE